MPYGVFKKKEKKTQEVITIFQINLLCFKNNFKCLKTFYNCFSYFFLFLNDVTRNLFLANIRFDK